MYKELIFLILLLFIASGKVYTVYGGDSTVLIWRETFNYVEIVRNGVERIYEIGKVSGENSLSHGDSLEYLDDGAVNLKRMGGGKLMLFGLPIEINTATVEDLTSISGIGPVKAKAIVRFRDERGGINSLDELKMVRGLGIKTVEKIKPYLTSKSLKPAKKLLR